MPEDEGDNSSDQDANGGTPARGEYKGALLKVMTHVCKSEPPS